MRQSKLFTKTRKEAPKDEESKNAKLLIRAGFIHKEMAGVYTLLPLGLRVIKKIEKIIREEMNKVGGVEMNLTALQEKTIWEKTDRFDDIKVDNWFKTKLKNENELGLAFTHEEPITNLMTEHIHSYKDLPVYSYQFQTKFRNELRAKSGIMRGREFLMKDLYSFSKNEDEHNKFYELSKEAYATIFDRVEIGDKTFLTFASGGTFSEFSHEFQTLTDAGEDIIYVDKNKKIAINEEVYGENTINKLGLNKDDLEEKKSVEVGNIFSLGSKFSEPLELFYSDEKDNKIPVFMGSYGIGLGRLMGTVVEVLSDNDGIVWPKEISPFNVHLLCLQTDDDEVKAKADDLYEKLQNSGVEVLYDDRDKGAGEKFGDADLIGISKQIVVSKKAIEAGKFEVKDRKTGEVTSHSESDIVSATVI